LATDYLQPDPVDDLISSNGSKPNF